MPQRSFIKNPFVFAAIICVVCSFALSLCAQVLRPLQERQVQIDTHRNILKAVGLQGETGTTLSADEVEKMFEEKLHFVAIDKDGNVDESADPKKVISGEAEGLYPIYLLQENGETQAFVLPLKGTGLWGPLSGYLALESDANTIRGVTFFPHKETPGLGAEIAKETFQKQFEGKHIRNEQGELVSIQVVKGKAAELAPDNIDHAVDGVSGATITSRGVDHMFDEWLSFYNAYFKKIGKA
jgi:Na+-transporting NADH:ubiquinone oxidoreductase subunit C